MLLGCGVSIHQYMCYHNVAVKDVQWVMVCVHVQWVLCTHVQWVLVLVYMLLHVLLQWGVKDIQWLWCECIHVQWVVV